MMKAVSDKQRAKRLAAGERFIGSSIAPKPVQPQPSSGYCPIRRKTKVKQSGKPKARNVKRHKENSVRANGSEARKVWMHEQPCAVCGWIGATQIAHVGNGGAGKKSNASSTLPMCGPHWGPSYEIGNGRRLSHLQPGCHLESHNIGVKSFENLHGVSLAALAKQTDEAWLAHSISVVKEL